MKMLPLTFVEKMFIALSVMGIVWGFCYTSYVYSTLPEIIPIHYTGGEADGFGKKGFVWLLPIVNGIIFSIIIIPTYIIRHFNHIVEVTEENKDRLHINNRLLGTVLAFECVAFFSYVTWQHIEVIIGKAKSLYPYSHVIFFLLLMLTVVFFAIRSFRLK